MVQQTLVSFFDFLWMSGLLLAPMLLLGLFLSGLIHVFISREAILRWLKDDSLKSVAVSSAVGVPVPLCSCSVVPVVAEMRRKGASRSSCMSFLITAPETGADSILVTNAFFGFIAAVVRPVISFITAVVAGIFCIGLIRNGHEETVSDHGHDEHEHDHDHDHGHDHDHDHDHGSHEPLIPETDDCYVSFSRLKGLFVQWLKSVATMAGRWKSISWVKPAFYREALEAEEAGKASPGDTSTEGHALDFKKLVKHIFHYGFVEIADDILFALLVGVALGGVLFLVIPGDLMTNEYARWVSYPVMVLVGVPLYICASASTPIAAALVAKGFSPGAALIFLMTGPATNTGTIAIIVSQFGARFATIYVAAVIAVTVALGIVIDALLLATGLTIPVYLGPSESPAIQFLQWGSALVLIALIIWRFRAGALRSGWEDLLLNIRPLANTWTQAWERLTRGRNLKGVISPGTPMGKVLWGLLLLLFLASGFTAVPPNAVGYGLLLGEVYWRDIQPGLSYLAPWPFVKVDKWPVREVKSILCETPEEYVSGDLNLISLTVNVQYRVKDPYVYHYRTEEPERVIADVVKAHVRSFISARDLERLLNVHRATLEDHLTRSFDVDVHFANSVLKTVEIVKVNLLDVSPVAETMSAFRDVSSAQEDRERIIVNAQRFLVSLVPQAHGNAAWEIQQADGEAYRKVKTAAAEADAISTVSRAVRNAPGVLRNMLWREKLETALAGNPKIIVPNKKSLEKVALWKRKTSGVNHGAPAGHRKKSH
ncbi:MAG: SO_0444 family Cu/Zn efflux transporter [Gemmatimonadota bacterium]|nr:SO_0444 family Cu/Zn efflux transporter [Gemmatimonadota bacterium]